MIGLAKVGKSLYSALNAARKYASTKRHYNVAFKSIVPVLKNPTMNRREFLSRGGKILSEARMQTNMANSVTSLKKEQIKSHMFLISPNTIKKMEKFSPKDIKKIDDVMRHATNPFLKGSFKSKVFDSIRSSKMGYKQDGYKVLIRTSKGLKPRNPAERWWYWREQLGKKYGHGHGTGTYTHKAFKIPNSPVYEGDSLLDYVAELSRHYKKTANPLFQAFREGLYGK